MQTLARLRSAAAVGLLLPLAVSSCSSSKSSSSPSDVPGWDQVPIILARIAPPTFPKHDCIVTDTKYGGLGDGATDNTMAFAAAIADCSSAGGGRVVAPAAAGADAGGATAVYFTGPIELKSNIDLHVEAGATIQFSTDPTKYLPVTEVSFEGSRLYNYKPLISAHDVANIAVTGEGTIDGHATMADWYSWIAMAAADSLQLRTQNANATPVAMRQYGEGHFLRPSLIEFMRCTNILLDGFTAKDSPFWTIHPVLGKNITLHNVTVLASASNTDAFDPESCQDVHVDGLKTMIGDDPLAIKAGRDLDGRTPSLYTTTENVVIENCTFASNNPTHGAAIAIGSEMSAGVRNVYVQDITYHDVPGILAQAIYLKASIYRGGFIENFYARRLHADSITTFFFINGQYVGGKAGNATIPPNQPVLFTKFDNINVDGADVKSVTSEAFRIDGPDMTQPATHINISNVAVSQTLGMAAPIRTGAAHYSGLTMTNVTVNGMPLTPPSSVP